jgi:hypothetical protein
VLIVTFDEDDHSAGNHIPTVFAGQQVRPGRYAEPVTHYSVLAAIEAAYALPGPATPYLRCHEIDGADQRRSRRYRALSRRSCWPHGLIPLDGRGGFPDAPALPVSHVVSFC